MRKQVVSWVNPKLVVRNSSTHGLGTFAVEPIKKGELVIVQGGRMITEDELDRAEYLPIAYHCFQVEKKIYISPLKSGKHYLDGIFKVNHSCEPTCGFRGQIALQAMKDILPGEEITYDYAMTDVGSIDTGWSVMSCNCGAEKCRGKITGEDWKMPELRKRYRGYFSTYIEYLIKE